MIKYDVLNRFTGNVKFTAEIDCEEKTPRSIKLGLSVKWGIKNDADLSYADLSDANLMFADLRSAYLRRTDLSGANLSGTNLRRTDLGCANLSGTNLRGADLGCVPQCLKIKDIHQEVYKHASQDGALNMGDWHACETTHCRAGWVVHLSGDAGKVLEWQVGTPMAATIIYMISDPKLEKVPDFYVSNEYALADMKQLAGL
jgi:hypothetical protein